MKILLDTDILIWALAEPAKLSEDGRMALEDPQNEILFSAASIWEIALEKRIRRIIFGFAPDQIAKAAKESGFAELPVFAIVAALVEQLPLHHRDPFDHLLIAQAMSELDSTGSRPNPEFGQSRFLGRPDERRRTSQIECGFFMLAAVWYPNRRTLKPQLDERNS
jgi:PIN domain nuclease of toxin-antitoxin system